MLKIHICTENQVICEQDMNSYGIRTVLYGKEPSQRFIQSAFLNFTLHLNSHMPVVLAFVSEVCVYHIPLLTRCIRTDYLSPSPTYPGDAVTKTLRIQSSFC